MNNPSNPNASVKPQNIIVILLDTHRADRLGFNGYQRSTSPNLDEFARSATVFERAIAPAQWTIPSHASMFTGLPPSTHLTTQASSVLDDRFKTCAEILTGAGYETVGFCNNPLVGLIHNNLKRGFENFYNYSGTTPDIPSDFPEGSIFPMIHIWESFGKTVRKMIDPIQNKFATSSHLLQAATNPFFVPLWTRFIHFKGDTARSIRQTTQYLAKKTGRAEEKPYLLFLNLMETHLPFMPPREYALRFAPYLANDKDGTAFMARFNTLAMHWLIPLKQPFTEHEARVISDLYDAEVAYQDHLLGELLAEMQKPAIQENSLVVIAADHGEMLGEHQFMGHGFGAYRELIQVPLMIHEPGQRVGRQVKEPVSTTRLFHTILEAAAVPEAVAADGSVLEVAPYSLRAAQDNGSGSVPALETKVVSEAYAPQDALNMMERREPELIEPLHMRPTHRALYAEGSKLYDIDGVETRLTTYDDELQAGTPALQEELAGRLEDFVRLSREGRPEGWKPATADLSNPLIEQRLRDLGYMA